MHSRRLIRCPAAALGLLAMLVSSAPASAPDYLIFDIGAVPPATASQGFRVSMTGTCTGRSFGNPTMAFTWTSDGGLVALPNLAGRTYCAGNGLNDVGDVIGTGTTTAFGSSPLPLLWRGGVVSQLPMPAGQQFGRGNDINNAGVGCGSVGSGSLEFGVLYTATTSTPITRLTGTGCFLRTAFSLNDAGWVVGFGIDPANAARNVGFVYDSVADVSFEVDPLPGHNGALAFDVSNAGHVVGASMLNQGSGLPFIWTQSGGAKAIDLPAGTSTGSARGVNNAGWVVGNAGGVYSVPWLYDGNATYDLQSLLPPGSGWDLSTNTSASAMGISEDGIITGTGVFSGGLTHAYAMVPSGPVAAMLQEFTAMARGDGIELRWALAVPGGVLQVVAERALNEEGPWLPVAMPVQVEAGTASLIDTTAEPGRTYHYRLVVTDGRGATFTLGSVAAQRGFTPGIMLGAATPNPAREGTAVAFRLPQGQPVRITVHDVRGRLVRTLLDGDLAEGDHAARWDGSLDGGVRAPAGLYFISMKTAQASRTQRVVLTR